MDLTNEIYLRASEFAGSAAQGENPVLLSMCRAAGAELVSRLREGVAAEDIEEQFVTAAGVLALGMYIELGGDVFGSAGSIRVGNVSVTRSSAAGGEGISAARLRKLAESMLAAYIGDSGFDFRGVRG